MELIYDLDDRQGIANVRFEGLDGTEGVTSVKGALSLMKIRNPAVAFREAVERMAYDTMSDEEYERVLDTVKLLSSLWLCPGNPEGKTEYEMNPLMLLANALEALCRLHMRCQALEARLP